MLQKGSKYSNSADSKSHILCLGSCGLQKQVGLEDFTKKAEETQHLVEQCLIQMKLFFPLNKRHPSDIIEGLESSALLGAGAGISGEIGQPSR